MKLETLEQCAAHGEGFELPMPPAGKPQYVPSLVAAMAKLVHYRCTELGAFDDLGVTPILDALMSPEEPRTDTGGTMSEAVHALKRLGARDIYCAASHALLSGPAVERLEASPVKEVAVSNSIVVPAERRFDRLKILSVAPLFSQAIRYTHSDQSVSSLFD